MTTAPVVSTVISPETVNEVRDVMRDAIAHRTPLQLLGAATWTGALAPVCADRTLSLRHLSGIVAYVPGDLTITAKAGTTLAELSHVTAAHGQWLGLDPAGDRMGSIGATIATASAGPLSHAFGTPRDLVLGLEAVTGYGDIVRPGGRVVKNVAGFDLVRLYTGSCGTLGAITEVTLRLRALPVHDVTLAIPVANAAILGTTLATLRQNTVSLLACEFLDGASAARLGVSSGSDVILVRVGGNDALIRGQRIQIERAGHCTPCDASVWRDIAALDAHATAVVRFSGSIDGLATRLTRLRDAAARTATPLVIHGPLARGVLRVMVQGDAAPLRALLQTPVLDEQRIPERLPHDWWVSEADPFAGGLAGRIRTAFDPHHLCNRRLDANA